MAFSFTGLAYLFGFFAVGLLVYRFFQYWREEKTLISGLFVAFAALFCLFFLVTAIGGLFFAKNPQILKGVVVSAAFLQGLAAAIVGYMIIYIKLPRISPWLGFSVVFLLGLIATILTIITPFQPFLEASGAINWDTAPLSQVQYLRFLVFLITFVPFGIVLLQQFRTTQDAKVRTRSLGLGLAFLFGLITALTDFLLETFLKLGAISSDIALAILSFVLLILVFLTQKAPTPKREYIPPPLGPKIQW